MKISKDSEWYKTVKAGIAKMDKIELHQKAVWIKELVKSGKVEDGQIRWTWDLYWECKNQWRRENISSPELQFPKLPDDVHNCHIQTALFAISKELELIEVYAEAASYIIL